MFDDWFSSGPQSDDRWRVYEKARGRSYVEALKGFSAEHTFNYDLGHIRSADIGVLALPAGKSAHLELGYMLGRGQIGFVLFDKEPARWDFMYKLTHGVFFNLTELLCEIQKLTMLPSSPTRRSA